MSEPTNRRERKKQHIQNILTETAIKLFTEKGFSQTTISEITEIADLATGTFYNYFQSKEDVIHHAISLIIAKIGHKLETIAESSMSPSEKLFAISYAAGQLFTENRNVFSLIAHLPPMTSPPHGEHFKKVLISIINEGWIRGDFNKDIPADMICEAFMAMLQSSIMSRTRPLEENIKIKLKILLNGICVPAL